MKKSLFLLSLLMITLVILLQSCGGGGGGTTATPPPAGTIVDLTAFKNIFQGTAAGTQYNFPSLSGTDLGGNQWSGSFTLAAAGATTFEGQNVTSSLATLQLTGANPANTTTTNYFLLSNGAPYKSVSSAGGSSLPPSLPAKATTGDSGPSTIVTRNDGSTATTTWALTADPSGIPVLLLSRSFTSGTTTTAEFDSFYLDAAGVPTKVTINVATAGTVVTLSGNRTP